MRPTCRKLGSLAAVSALIAATGCVAASQYLERRGPETPYPRAYHNDIASGTACPGRVGLRECSRIGTFDELWVVASPPASRPGWGQIETARGTLKAVIRGREVAMQAESTAVNARVSGLLAEIRLAQEYRNEWRRGIDAVYELQLPAGAAVTDLLIVVGRRRIRAVIRERKEAEAVYREARALGYRTSLLELTAGSLLRQRVANLDPGGSIRVETGWFQPLQRAGDSFVLRLAGPGKGGRFSVKAQIEAGARLGGITSEARGVTVKRATESSASVALEQERADSDRHFVLRWRTAEKAPRAAIMTHRGKSGGTFALFLHPPAEAPSSPPPARDLVLVLDPHGSPSARAAGVGFARRCLEMLRSSDRFRLVPGDDRLLRATPENVKRAVQGLQRLKGDEDSSLAGTLRAALRLAPDPSRRQSFALITDGNSVGASAALSAKPDYLQVSAVAVGDRVDARELERVAELGRGLAVFAGTGEQVGSAAEQFMRATSRAVVTDLCIDWGKVEVADVYPKRIPDLLPARPLMIVGRFRCDGRQTVKVLGSSAGRKIVMNAELDASGKAVRHPAVEKMWARWRLRELQRRELAAPGAEVRRTIVQTSLRHGVLSRYTALLAVDALEPAGNR